MDVKYGNDCVIVDGKTLTIENWLKVLVNYVAKRIKADLTPDDREELYNQAFLYWLEPKIAKHTIAKRLLWYARYSILGDYSNKLEINDLLDNVMMGDTQERDTYTVIDVYTQKAYIAYYLFGHKMTGDSYQLSDKQIETVNLVFWVGYHLTCVCNLEELIRLSGLPLKTLEKYITKWYAYCKAQQQPLRIQSAVNYTDACITCKLWQSVNRLPI